MKKVLKGIGILLLAAILFVLIAGLFVPKDYHFERSIVIQAPREIIWQNISQFRNFEKWDPWSSKDPAMSRTIEGTDGTVGAVYRWKGNKEVGSGSQTIMALDPTNHVDISLKFKEPYSSEAKVFYNLQDTISAIKVTWGFNSEFPYPFNTFRIFMNMDKMMDADFSKGLANLKAISESKAEL